VRLLRDARQETRQPAPKRANGRIAAIKANLTISGDGTNATYFMKLL
jgi:hypothetical protein